MENQATTRKWSELHKLNVVDPKEGKILGQVNDFFVKEGSLSVYALSVSTRLYGNLTLPVTGIKSIEKNSVNVINSQMLLKAVPGFTRGQDLFERKIVGENGTRVGALHDVILAIDPIVATRLASLEVEGKRGPKTFSADAITGFNHQQIIIDEKLAKRLS